MTEPHLPIYERVMHDVEDLFRPHGYHEPSTPATAAQEAPVDLATIEQDVRTAVQAGIDHAEAGVTELKAIVEQHLPALAAEAQRAQASPVIQALEGAFLPPEDEAMIATLIGKLAGYAAEHAAQVPADPQGPAVAGVA